MSRILLLLNLFFLVGPAAMAQSAQTSQSSSWQRYTVKGEQFSVILPTLPAMITRKVTLMPFTDPVRRRTLGAYADGLAFTVWCIENSNPGESLEKFIERDIPRYPAWDRSSEQDLTQNGFKGKQYFLTNRVVPGVTQIFATRSVFYRFEAFGATMDDVRVKDFFASIVLGKNNEGIEVSDGPGLPDQTNAPSQTQPDEKILVSKEVDRRPFVAMKPEPSYTEDARQHKIVGAVILKVVFSADGTITNISVESGLRHGLTERAIAAARMIKFIPAIKDGRFVSTWMQLEYHFNLY